MTKKKETEFNDSELFISRELSWMDFNARVLDEAECVANPVLERLKFIAIFSSNLDEFFMVRIAGLRQLVKMGKELPDPAGEMGKSVRLNATIYRFEFDRARHTAVLSVEFSGKAGDVTERTSQLTYETPYEGDAPEAAAKAMAVNAERAAQAVRELIASLSKK